jgi:hypothetical protein
MPMNLQEGLSVASDWYRGERIALLTQHGKERVIAPVLNAVLGCWVERVAGYDTDLLGTFTREIPREGTQIEAARNKARLGMQLAKLTVGIASEGAFGPDPLMGMLPRNIELIIWIDEARELEIVGMAQGKANWAHRLVASWEDAECFARQVGFPEYHLVVRPEGENDPRIHKGIAAWSELKAIFTAALAQSANGEVFLETDFRAYANPMRMETIRLAAEDLARKLCSFCPACGFPGFGRVERIAGLPCEGCGAPTREIQAEVFGCLKCAHRVTYARTDIAYADAGCCDYCNP